MKISTATPPTRKGREYLELFEFTKRTCENLNDTPLDLFNPDRDGREVLVALKPGKTEATISRHRLTKDGEIYHMVEEYILDNEQDIEMFGTYTIFTETPDRVAVIESTDDMSSGKHTHESFEIDKATGRIIRTEMKRNLIDLI